MIDHTGFAVSDYETSKAFFTAALAPLGYALMMEVTDEMTGGHGDHAGFGAGQPDFWIGTGATGLRPQYHPDDYGAFVLDPDDNNIEAVCHDPE